MINSLQLTAGYRDFWQSWDPMSIAQLAPLAFNDCLFPVTLKSPNELDQSVAPGGFVRHTITIPAGSIIYGFKHPQAIGFRFQVTDVSLDHKWFTSAIDDALTVGNPWLFPAPYPVVGAGNFLVEFWNPSTTQTLVIQMYFAVASIIDCDKGV